LAIVIVGGSGKDVGKTALVCAVISALSKFGWTAVKVTGHSYEAEGSSSNEASGYVGPTVCEETMAGQETDTGRYLAAGARRALMVTRCGSEIPIDEIRASLEEDRNILFESNRIVDVVRPDVCLALVGGPRSDWKPSFLRLLPKADAVVSLGALEMESAELAARIPHFELNSLDRLTPEFERWMRSRLSPSDRQDSKG
jgi:hypothetical protein